MHIVDRLHNALVIAKGDRRQVVATEDAIPGQDKALGAQAALHLVDDGLLGGAGTVLDIERHDDALDAGIIVKFCAGAVGTGGSHLAVKHILDDEGTLWQGERVVTGIGARVGAHHAVHVHEGSRGVGATAGCLVKHHHQRRGGQVGVDEAAGGIGVVLAHMGVGKLDVAHRLARAVDDVIGVAVNGNQALAIDVDEVVVLDGHQHLVILIDHAGLLVLDDDKVARRSAGIVGISSLFHLLLVADGIGHFLARVIQADERVALDNGQHAIDEIGLHGLVLGAAGGEHHLAALVDDGKGHDAVIVLMLVDDHGIVFIEKQVGAAVVGRNNRVAAGVDIAPRPVIVLEGGHAAGKHRALGDLLGQLLDHLALAVDDGERTTNAAGHGDSIVAERGHTAEVARHGLGGGIDIIVVIAALAVHDIEHAVNHW